ncbi:unnamed protein product [Meganyctiphanes norvegica]|uniref:Glycosyltransferase family 92 protein n=1 Tax=Meganyctiphanes norvegica TaxID=48144 RepID=A0AAV2RGM7_MEGNR
MIGIIEENKRNLLFSEYFTQNQVYVVMRKYQQLALTIISAVSLVAFLFYKHEYDRLRYTLEYLDTFGQPPSDNDIKPSCGYGTHRRVSTPPVDWIQVTPDLQVYSSFFDDTNGMGEPQVRTIAAVRKSSEPPTDLGSLLWFETEEMPVPGSCNVEQVVERPHGIADHKYEELQIMFIMCSAENKKLMLSKVPYMIQFTVGKKSISGAVYIHETETLKSVEDTSAVCIAPLNSPIDSLRVVEFFAYHNIIGFKKFTAYGTVLTPLARRLFDKYGDEIGISVEEKQFSSSKDFILTDFAIRKVIELDCLYRHRDAYENVIILTIDEYLVPQHKDKFQEVLFVLSGGGRRHQQIGEFHLLTQKICLDSEHFTKGVLLSAKQTHVTGETQEEGVAILRPHLIISSLGTISGGKSSEAQHINAASALVYHYISCSPGTNMHLDTHHLPISAKTVDKLEKSLLIRKWKVNQW